MICERKVCKGACGYELAIHWFPLNDGVPGPVCQTCRNERQRERDRAARALRNFIPPDPIGIAFKSWRMGATGQLLTPMGVFCQNERLAA